MAQASTLVLFNKNIANLAINVGRTNVQNPLDFLTALLVDRHKRGRLRHHEGLILLNYLKNIVNIDVIPIISNRNVISNKTKINGAIYGISSTV